MKKVLFGLFILFLFASCKKEQTKILDFTIKESDISKIELRADHKTLLPNGVSRMQFYPIVYSKKKIEAYTRDVPGGPFETKQVEQEFVVPSDLIPRGMVKVYGPDGKEVKDNIYSTTTDAPGTVLDFLAKGGNVQSNSLNITIRELPDESYDSIIVPVIFHVLLPPLSIAPSYEVTSEFLQQQLDHVSDVMNRRVTTDPNAGNAKIRFVLAEYGPNGVRLVERGKNIQNISASDMAAMGTSSDISTGYKAYILKKKSQLIWDPNKYMNIWLAKFSNSTSTYGSRSYKYLAPTVMSSSFPLSSIPGLSGIRQQDTFNSSDVTDCLQVGIIVNFKSLLDPSVQNSNEFSLATPIAGYYGVLETYNEDYRDLNADGDNDYCPDTYNYDYAENQTVFKNNVLYRQPANDPDRPLEYFTSFNVMDFFSRKNSLSVDQINRVRKVLVQCPSRWSYKSDWAFTGK